MAVRRAAGSGVTIPRRTIHFGIGSDKIAIGSCTLPAFAG
jgi:hypothetical protein